jgi:uncharacterized protein (UPF0548 family)
VSKRAEWRFGRGWSRAELDLRLARLATAERNFGEPLGKLGELSAWRHYCSDGLVGRETVGAVVPDGPFDRGRTTLSRFAFSDPRIVRGWFDADSPLLGRRMLLEIRVLGLRYLCGVVIGAVRDEAVGGRIVFGYRYETLEGHIERGAEWFLLAKDVTTGYIDFQIQAHWREGQFPNWWSHVGFHWLAQRYQRRWHRSARARMIRIMGVPEDEHGGDCDPPRGGDRDADLHWHRAPEPGGSTTERE